MAQALIEKVCLDMAEADTPEQYLTALGMYETIMRRIKEYKDAFAEARLGYHERCGDVEALDGRRFYEGKVKRTKCRDVSAAFEALLDATHGDATAMAEALSANALKPGHCKQVEGFDWDAHFTVEEVKDVKTGKAKREVKLADDRYLRAG